MGCNPNLVCVNINNDRTTFVAAKVQSLKQKYRMGKAAVLHIWELSTDIPISWNGFHVQGIEYTNIFLFTSKDMKGPLIFVGQI